MSLLVRKINRAKWQQNKILDGEQPSADAITACLKTSNNSLSVWQIDDESNLASAILAYAARCDHIETFDVALIDEDRLVRDGIELADTPGLTPFLAMVKSHRDISNLDYPGLGKVATAIVSCFRNGAVKRYRRANLIELLESAVESGDVPLGALQPDVQKYLRI